MKLLVFSPYYPPHIGGLQSHAEQFNQQMSKTGAHITVFTSRLPNSAPSYEIKNSVKIIRFPAWEIIPNYPLPKFWQAAFWREWQQLKRQSFDVTISRTRFFATSLLALIYAKSTKTPWLHIEHGSDFVSLANPLTNFLARLYDYTLGRLIFHLADRIIANSLASAGFVKRLSGRRAAVIYRGVDQETIINTVPDQNIKNTHQNKIIITFLGRLIDGKGANDLLQAIRTITSYQLPITSCSFHCLIIGDGPRRRSLATLAKQLGIAEHVSFLGQLDFSQSVSILKASDIFVNPSHTEGLPTSVIEAALCHTAIIATNVGGTPEIVTDGISGCLIPPRNSAILSSKLKLLIEAPAKREQLASRAYNKVISKFSWQPSIAAYYKLLKQMLKSQDYVWHSRKNKLHG